MSKLNFAHLSLFLGVFFAIALTPSSVWATHSDGECRDLGNFYPGGVLDCNADPTGCPSRICDDTVSGGAWCLLNTGTYAGNACTVDGGGGPGTCGSGGNAGACVGDTTPPFISVNSVGGDSSSPYSTTQTKPIFNISVDEDAICKYGVSDVGYSTMVTTCFKNGLNHLCNDTGSLSFAPGSRVVHIACRDTIGNEHTSANNKRIDFQVTAALPVASVSPLSPLDFGTVPVGSSDTRGVTVENTGGGTLSGSLIGLSGPFSCISGCNPSGSDYILSAGATHSMVIQFSPTASGPVLDTATFTNTTNPPGATYTFLGTGGIVAVCSGVVSLTLNPNIADPGDIVQFSASGLSDCGAKTIEFRQSSCTGILKGSCSGASGCTDGSFSAPSSDTIYAACIDINGDSTFSGGNEINTKLLAINPPPPGSFTISPPIKLTCPDTPVGGTASCSFSAVNLTGSPQSVTSVTSSNPTNFEVATPMPLDVPDGESLPILIIFHAITAGTNTGVITFTVPTGTIERDIEGTATGGPPPPPVDADGDGLDDAWEITHFGDITSQDGTGDPDGDGCDNECEETAGTDPNSAPGLPGIVVTFPNPIDADNFPELINTLIDFLFTIAVIVAPILLVVAGVIFMTAAGDPSRVATARRMLLWTIIGFGIILISKGLVEVLRGILGL